jgi:hypothetical protein
MVEAILMRPAYARGRGGWLVAGVAVALGACSPGSFDSLVGAPPSTSDAAVSEAQAEPDRLAPKPRADDARDAEAPEDANGDDSRDSTAPKPPAPPKR